MGADIGGSERSNAKRVANLTINQIYRHTGPAGRLLYFNLSGKPDVYSQRLTIQAGSYLAVGAKGLPTGDRISVAGTALDLRRGELIGDIVSSTEPSVLKAHGLDHMFVLNGQGLREIASLEDPQSGRVMTVTSTEPALVTYAANGFNGSMKDEGGRPLDKGAGVSMEIQHFPDSPHHSDFPTTVLRPGEVYHSTTQYLFSVQR